MTNIQCIGIMSAMLVGFAGHALLRGGTCVQPATPPTSDRSSVEVAQLQASSMETLALLQHGSPKVLQIGDRTLLVDADWKKEGGDFKVTTKYYELRDGSLVRVPLEEGQK